MDVNRAFVLHCCSMVNYNLVKNNKEKVLEFLKMATLNTLLLLDPSDNHAKQVEVNLNHTFTFVEKL